MENLNDKDKVLLRSLSRYLRSHGMKYGLIDFELDWGNKLSLDDKTSFGNNWTAEIPEFIKPTLQKVIDFIKSSLDSLGGLDNVSFNQVEINIDAVDQELTVSRNYGYYEESDTMTNTWDMEDDPEPLANIFSALDESGEKLDDVLTLRYNGSGDSGYIEDEFEEGGTAPKPLEDFCYDQLEALHGGWEINEGSQGYFEIDTVNKTITLNHAFNEEKTESDNLLQFYFGN